MVADEGKAKLDQAYDRLQEDVPDPVCRAIQWLREPRGRWVRMPLGLFLVVTGFFGFLPVLGYEFIPLGLLLLAQDLPPLRKPVANATLWLEGKWRNWRQHRRERKRHQHHNA